MKNTKLVATLGAVALVAAVGLGSTLAYLSDNAGPVTNTFTLSKVTFDKELQGGLAEQEVILDENGKYVHGDADGNERIDWVTSINYAKVTPNETVEKNPTAFIGKDSEPAYLFVRVSQSADFSNINMSEDFKKVADIKDDNGKVVAIDYVYNGNDGIAAPTVVEKEDGTTETTHTAYEIFDKVTIAANLDSKHATDLDAITVKAALIQAEGFDNADAAYAQAASLLAQD
ncbi:MAG: hypothetical protein K6A05_07145 [Lachnospiraceae bacterium]|nr:hypothetical protein [Lachnospiraceae bacterium]